jgi:hypothetical protein
MPLPGCFLPTEHKTPQKEKKQNKITTPEKVQLWELQAFASSSCRQPQ